MWFSEPMRVGPLMTACDSTVVPAPMLTSGPMMLKGPTETSGASSARGETLARGSIMARGHQPRRASFPRSRGHHHLRARHLVRPHERDGRKAPDAFQGALDPRGENDLVAGHDRLTKARAVDADEVEPGVLVRHHIAGDESENAGRLRQRLDDDDSRHHRPMREVAREVRLVIGDVLERADALALLNLEHAIHEHEGVPVRQIP